MHRLSMKSKPELGAARKPGERNKEGNSRDVQKHTGQRSNNSGGGFGNVDWFTAAMNKEN